MYNSYNCFPGWLPATPFQRLVTEYQKFYNGVQSQKRAAETLSKLKDSKSSLFKMLPDLSARLEGLSNKPIDYLLQEYNHPVWQPIYSSDMLRIASSYKFDFLASAILPLAFDKSYTKTQKELLASHDDLALRECVKDIACNVQFRKDVYVKGASPLWRKNAQQSVLSQHIVFKLNNLSDLQGLNGSFYKFPVGNGNTTTVSKNHVETIVGACKQSKCQISDLLVHTGLPFQDVVYIVSLMLANGSLALAPQSIQFDECVSLNKVILNSFVSGAPYSHLVCPEFSSAIQLGIHSMLCASQLSQVSPENDLISCFVSTAESLGLMFNGDKLSGKKLLKFAEKNVSDFNDNSLPLLLKSRALTSLCA